MIISPQIIFYVLISIIVLNFIKDYLLDYINAKFFNKKIPENLNDIYDKEKYQKSQDYKKTLYKFGKVSKFYSFTILLLLALWDLYPTLNDIGLRYLLGKSYLQTKGPFLERNSI